MVVLLQGDTSLIFSGKVASEMTVSGFKVWTEKGATGDRCLDLTVHVSKESLMIHHLRKAIRA